MKKSSKVLSMVLAILTAMSCFTGMATISASAAEDHRIYFQVPTIEEWGVKKMAYPVKGHEKGYYIIFNFNAEHTDVEQLENFYKKESNIIKHIIVLNS